MVVNFLQRTLRLHRKIRMFVGLGDVKQPHNRRIYRIYGFVLIGLFVLLQATIYLSLRNAQTILDATNVLTPGVVMTLIVIKYGLFVVNRPHTESAVNIMRELEKETVRTIADRAIMRRVITYSDWVVLIALWSCVVTVNLRFVVSLIVGKHELMFPATLPGDWPNNYPLYLLYNCIQLVLTTLGSTCMGTLDSFGPTLYLLLDAFVEILCKRVQLLGKAIRDSSEETYLVDTEEQEKCLQELIECIVVHQKCLKISEHINLIFGIHYLCQFGACCVGLCTIIFIITQIRTTVELFDQLHIVVSVMPLALEVFVPCLFSNMLNVKSGQLLESLFACNWTNQSKRFKSTLVIFMQRARRPIRLTTYNGVFEINLTTFVKVCKTTYSLLSCMI